MANEDMDGSFFGGGGINHVVADGEIYLQCDQIAQLIGSSGVRLALSAIKENEPSSATTAQLLMVISDKMYTLRSELLKREIEASFNLD